jgi:hypothetical protein
MSDRDARLASPCTPDLSEACAIAHEPEVARPSIALPSIDRLPQEPAAAPEAHSRPLPGTPAGEAGSGTALANRAVGPHQPRHEQDRTGPEAGLDDGEGQVGWVGPCSPERPVMEILFRCIEAGRRYYAVRLNGQEIFVGTRPECDRFLSIHNEKVAVELAEMRRTPRGRPAQLHVYRTARA